MHFFKPLDNFQVSSLVTSPDLKLLKCALFILLDFGHFFSTVNSYWDVISQNMSDDLLALSSYQYQYCSSYSYLLTTITCRCPGAKNATATPSYSLLREKRRQATHGCLVPATYTRQSLFSEVFLWLLAALLFHSLTDVEGHFKLLRWANSHNFINFISSLFSLWQVSS